MAEMETTEPAKLGRGNLRLADVVAQAVGFMGPVFSVTFFLTAIGGAAPPARARASRSRSR